MEGGREPATPTVTEGGSGFRRITTAPASGISYHTTSDNGQPRDCCQRRGGSENKRSGDGGENHTNGAG